MKQLNGKDKESHGKYSVMQSNGNSFGKEFYTSSEREEVVNKSENDVSRNHSPCGQHYYCQSLNAMF